MKSFPIKILILGMIMVFLSACKPDVPSTPVPLATVTQSLENTITPLPSQTATLEPSPEPVHTATSTAEPSSGGEIFFKDYGADGEAIQNVILAEDGKYLGVFAADNSWLDLWTLETGQKMARVTIGAEASFAVSSNYQSVAVYEASMSEDVTLWNTVAGAEPQQIVLHVPDELVTTVDYSPDGEQIAVGYSSGKIRIFGTADGEELQTIAAYGDWVVVLLYSPDGKFVFSDSISFDPTTKIFDPQTGAVLATVNEEDYELCFGFFSPNSQYLAAKSMDGMVIYRTSDWKVMGQYGFDLLGFTADSQGVLVAGKEGVVAVYDVATGEKMDIPADLDQPPAFVANVDEDKNTVQVVALSEN